MAAQANPAGLTRLAAALALTAAAALPQVRITLQQAQARRAPDFRPAYYGQQVQVTGQVTDWRVKLPFLHYDHLSIEERGYGLTLDTAPDAFSELQPGDRVEATGRLDERGGMPVLKPSAVRVLAHGEPPQPQPLTISDLQGFRHLGELVQVEGRITEIGDTSAGPYMLISDRGAIYKLFLPYSDRVRVDSLTGFAIGDGVRVKGLASQYCPVPPFDRMFQLMVRDPAYIGRTERSWIVPRSTLGGALLAVLAAVLIWLTRERRLRQQREVLRRAYQLSEELLAGTSVDDLVKRLQAALPRIFGISSVRLYLYNRGARTLDPVPGGGPGEAAPVPLATAGSGPQAGAVACFHYRTLLAIPDTSRSPFPVRSAAAGDHPRALLFVPMFAQGEIMGVLELAQQGRTRDFSSDQQTLAQHLGNQMGAAIRLLDQRNVREQLYRTEKLAAVGKLISGVVNELQAPLENIGDLVVLALREQPRPARAMELIATEAQRASDIVSRLISFASSEQVQARPVDLNRLLRNLMEFREQEWKAQGIQLHDQIAAQPLFVLGVQGQLEQVFLNMLVHAELLLAEAPEKSIGIRTSTVGSRILVEISYSLPRDGDPFAHWPEEAPGALGLGVCRGIVAGHGGELRMLQTPGAGPRFEVELPCAPRERQAAVPAAASRTPAAGRTAMVIEPDEVVQRQLLQALSAHGYRVVPAQNSDTGLDMAQRMRFDAVFCSVRAPGLNWIELSEEMQSRVGCFVLLAEGYDPELVENFEGEGRLVLSKPIEDREMERVLQRLGAAGQRAPA